MSRVVALALATSVACVVPAFGRPQDPQQSDQAVQLGTAEVDVDVVVRDKDGRPIRDLTEADFEVVEEGAPQDITSFHLVSRDPKATPSRDGMTSVSAVALVFDRLSPEGRKLAKEGALSFVNEGMGPSDLVGVFTVDLSLQIIQPFTNDANLVRAALERVAGLGDTAALTTDKDLVRTLQERQYALDRQIIAAEAGAAAAGQAGGNPGGQIGTLQSERIANEMTIRSAERFDDLERDQASSDAVDGLLSVVTGLGRIPGRKAVIFFSEGIPVTGRTQDPFRSIIGNANRLNVSFYTVDAGGLKATSDTSEAAKRLVAAGNARIEENATGRGGGSSPMLQGTERNENSMRSSAEVSLRELASGTGGFLINNTNDPGKRLRQVDDDLRVHYALTYAPKNQDFDGKYREISVKVKRSGAQVQTRRGYYAVNASSDVTLLPSEAPAFAALHSGKGPISPNVHVLPMSFPERQDSGLTKILIQVPVSKFTLTDDPSTKTYKTDFTILAILRGSDGRIAAKVSRHYTYSGPSDQSASFSAGSILFYKEAHVPPGAYSVEAVAYDAPSDKSEFARARLVVPASDATLRMSSLVIIERGEKLTAEDMKTPDPLHVADTLIYPNLGDPLSKKMGKLSFFATLYTAPSTSAPKLMLEIAQAGKVLAQLPVDVPAADAQGRIQVVNALPLEVFPPGQYQLRLSASDGKSTVARAAPFTVVQ